MSDNVRRFISGEISRCNLAQTDQYGKYSIFIKGAFEDTKELVEGYYNSKFPVTVFAGEPEPLTLDQVKEQTNGQLFQGRIMVDQSPYNGKEYFFLKAVSIENPIGADEYQPEDKSNPFLDNPLN